MEGLKKSEEDRQMSEIVPFTILGRRLHLFGSGLFSPSLVCQPGGRLI